MFEKIVDMYRNNEIGLPLLLGVVLFLWVYKSASEKSRQAAEDLKLAIEQRGLHSDSLLEDNEQLRTALKDLRSEYAAICKEHRRLTQELRELNQIIDDNHIHRPAAPDYERLQDDD